MNVFHHHGLHKSDFMAIVGQEYGQYGRLLLVPTLAIRIYKA